MHSPLHQQLMHEIYAIIALARPVVEAIERRDRDLGTQARRALNSIALNTAEGLGVESIVTRLSDPPEDIEDAAGLRSGTMVTLARGR